MSHSISVIGLVSDDSDQYRKHSAVLNACILAGVQEMPLETALFFGCERDEVHSYVLEEVMECSIPKHEYSADMTEGYEVVVSEIPDNVERIRFTISW